MEQVPSVGRIVHYVSYGTPGGEYASQCRAAVITEVGLWITEFIDNVGYDAVEDRDVRVTRQLFFDDAVNLCVLNPSGQFFNQCKHDEEEKDGGTWHWPERV